MPLYAIPFDPGMTPPTDDETDAFCRANDMACTSECPPSTPRAFHLQLVENIVEHLKKLEKETGVNGKIIAARVMTAPTSKSPSRIYYDLRAAYPDATVFLFSTPFTGTWVGASPELLLSRTQSHINTVSLAGTREATPADASPAPWDAKNRVEQQIVTDFITTTLREVGFNPECSAPYTRRAGNVEHICTDISAPLCADSSVVAPAGLSQLTRLLAPTPALSGYPRREAVEFINTHEHSPRYCYGGTIGYVTPDSARIYVNLRSGRLFSHKGSIALYAGGGITRDSVAEQEWEETCRKLTTLLPHI